MQERPNKASICSVVCLDIPDQSSKPVFRQIQDKGLFDSIISEALGDIPADEHVLAETGNGKTISFRGAPEAAIFTAMMIRDAVNRHNSGSDEKLLVRTGIGIGPVIVDDDASSVARQRGEGVNAAERMKALAEPGQILVSRTFHDITAGLTEEIASLFSPVVGQEAYAIRLLHEEAFVPESAAGIADAPPPLISRLLESENSSRYGLWSSVAIVAIIMLVGGFLLFSNLLRPDLGVVIADSKPAAPSADLRAVSVPAAPAASEPLSVPESDSSPSEPVVHEPMAESSAPQTVTVLEPENQLPPAQASQKKRKRAQSMEPVGKTESETVATEISEPANQVAEPIPVEPVVVPQEEPKKVAASPPPKKRPVVEERRVPAGVRGKTLWDDFRESFKQGTTQHVCTQAEIALNQCRE